MLRRFGFVTLGLATYLSVPVAAQQATPGRSVPAAIFGEKAAYHLVYDHVSGNAELRNNRNRVIERWQTRGVARAAAPLLPVPPDRPLIVIVDNANSLLYDYDVNVDLVGQKELRSCKNIGAQFTASAFLAGLGSISGLAAPAPPDVGTTFAPLQQGFADVGAARGEAMLTEESLENTLDLIRQEVTGYLDWTDGLVQLSTSLGDSLASIGVRAESEPIGQLLEQLQASVEGFGTGLSDPARVPQTISGRYDEDVRGAVTALGTVTAQINGRRYSGLSSDGAVVEALALASRFETSIANLEASVPTLQAELIKIENAKAESIQGFTSGPSQGAYRRVVVSIRNKPDLDVPQFREGDIEVFTEPSVGLLCHISFGFAIMDPAPSFALNSDAEVIDEQDDDVRTAAAVFLHVASPAVPILGVMLGVGLGSEKLPDFYLGGTIRLFEPLLINGGIVWAREKLLPDNLILGETVTDLTVLDDLDKRFRSRFFVGVSIVP